MNAGLLHADTLLSGLRPHPRLLVDDVRLGNIRAVVAHDAFAAAALRQGVTAITTANLGPPVHTLRYTEKALDLLATCGLVWRLNHDPASLACAREHLVAICSGPAWSRDNFLAIGELAYALALGYDWLRDGLSVADRELVRRFIVDNILKLAVTAYDEGDWWIDAAINWNHECNGGMIMAALAVADSDPDIARAVIPRAVRWLDHALEGYEPDGAWDEGAGYWGRATIFAGYAMAALDSALGTDFGLSERRGYAETARFFLAAIGPTGVLAGYADCEDRRKRTHLPILLWMAKRYTRPEYARCEIDHAQANGAIAAHLWWYQPIGESPALALDQHFRAPGSFVSLRSAWNDPRAIYVWTKGGNNQVNHGHLDQGAFEVDALGQRWARDLGVDDYSLPGYFDRQPGGRRWTYYRLNSLSHSVPLIDGANQQPCAIVRITGFLADPRSPRAIVELSEAYKPAAGLARRGIMLLERRAVMIQDEFTLAKPARFTWAMTTDAAITLAGATATLSLGGELLVATILEPPGAVFSQESAERQPPERPNTGVSRLLIDLPKIHGRLRVVVLLAPRWPDGIAVTAPVIVPLGQWI